MSRDVPGLTTDDEASSDDEATVEQPLPAPDITTETDPETDPETETEVAPDTPPPSAAPRRRRAKGSGRRGVRVTQRLWSVDPWSIFKISALFYLCMFLIILVATAVLWNVGRSMGTVDSVEGFVTRMGAYGSCQVEEDVPEGVDFESDDDCREGEVLVGGFQIDDGTLFKATAIGGVILVVAGSLGNVLMIVLLNLLNEVTGGVRHTVVAEPVARRPGGSTRPAQRR